MTPDGWITVGVFLAGALAGAVAAFWKLVWKLDRQLAQQGWEIQRLRDEHKELKERVGTYLGGQFAVFPPSRLPSRGPHATPPRE